MSALAFMPLYLHFWWCTVWCAVMCAVRFSGTPSSRHGHGVLWCDSATSRLYYINVQSIPWTREVHCSTKKRHHQRLSALFHDHRWYRHVNVNKPLPYFGMTNYPIGPHRDPIGPHRTPLGVCGSTISATRPVPVAEDATRTRTRPVPKFLPIPDPTRAYTRTRSLPVWLPYNKR